jgi:hypothetical protein
MYKQRIGIAIVTLLLVVAVTSTNAGVEQFLGRWALDLPGGAGWLQVEKADGYLDANILWYGGSVVPVDYVHMEDDVLVVTRMRRMERDKDENGDPQRIQTSATRIEFARHGGVLVGKLLEPSNNGLGTKVTRFAGNKIPDLSAAPNLKALKYGKSIKLLNGKDLTGWELKEPKKKNGWIIKDGALLNDPVQEEGKPHVSYGNLKTVAKFEDFNLKMQVNVPKGNNSGIYLRGIYEVQVYDSYGKPLDSHNMGAVYSRITPTVAAEKPAGSWQDIDITLCDRHVNVVLNGKTIIDNQPLLGCTGGAMTSNEFIPGPIYLQGDHGKVSYRNIVLTPIVK